MKLLRDMIGVEFDMSHNNVYNVGGIELVRPDKWEHENTSYSETGTMYQKNTNLKDTLPQIATVIVENDNMPFKMGDKVFVHYLALNNAQEIEGVTAIHGKSVFFKIKDDGSYEMMEDVYLGQRVFNELEKTTSGIYLTSGEKGKEPLKIRITHAPKNSPLFKVGDTVLTVDDNQYELNVYEDGHIKLNTWDIAIKIED